MSVTVTTYIRTIVTQFGGWNLAQNLASIFLTTHYDVVSNVTNYIITTFSIVTRSNIVTRIARTYTLTWGNINTSTVLETATNYVETVIITTFTLVTTITPTTTTPTGTTPIPAGTQTAPAAGGEAPTTLVPTVPV